jgi:hypothetical protein
MRADPGRVALLWRDARPGRGAASTRNRLRPVFEALADLGIKAEPVVYSDATADEVRGRLARCDGVLVWVDPIAGVEDRTILDALLRDVSAAGVWVSAHPDTILKMGTKEVLYRTRHLSWGSDTHLYMTFGDFAERFPARMAAGKPRVLKQYRGNGGIGVWKVEVVDGSPTVPSLSGVGNETIVRVQHAAPRDAVTEDVPLAAFIERCAQYFAKSGRLVDQAFADRLPEGMIRAYLVEDQVVGFARQQPADSSSDRDVPPPGKILGLPSAKAMYAPSEPEFDTLRAHLEEEWVPALRAAVGLENGELPLLWDADFLLGPPTRTGADTYILCEINVSSVLPFPDQAPGRLARAVHARLTTS